jgi:hypothetical protein
VALLRPPRDSWWGQRPCIDAKCRARPATVGHEAQLVLDSETDEADYKPIFIALYLPNYLDSGHDVVDKVRELQEYYKAINWSSSWFSLV